MKRCNKYDFLTDNDSQLAPEPLPLLLEDQIDEEEPEKAFLLPQTPPHDQDESLGPDQAGHPQEEFEQRAKDGFGVRQQIHQSAVRGFFVWDFPKLPQNCL